MSDEPRLRTFEHGPLSHTKRDSVVASHNCGLLIRMQWDRPRCQRVSCAGMPSKGERRAPSLGLRALPAAFPGLSLACRHSDTLTAADAY